VIIRKAQTINRPICITHYII